MSNNINLISVQGDYATRRYLKIFRSVSIVAIITVGFISVLLFLIKAKLTATINDENKKIAAGSADAIQKKEAKIFLINNRMQYIQPLLSSRAPLDKDLDTLFSAMPSGISIDSFDVDKKKVTLTISSTTLQSLDTVMTTLISYVDNRELINRLTLDSIVMDQDGRYSTTLEAVLL